MRFGMRQAKQHCANPGWRAWPPDHQWWSRRWQWLPLPSPEARCLDGSRAGISYRTAAGGTSPTIRQANKKRWILYFEGGGWCFIQVSALSSNR